MASRFPRHLVRLVWLAALLGVSSLARGTDLTVTTPDRTWVITPSVWSGLPRMELVASDPHGGASHSYAGVSMRDLLLQAGAPLGDKLRGPNLRTGVLIEAADGYAVLYALAEFDEAFSERRLLLADRKDGAALGESAAPFQLIVPGDKRGARSIRQVKSITLVQPAKP
ncbi:MAG TPA: hypothetical protein VGD88_13090 [Opitutaceae bacterium]